jgi:hypothetical protein
VGAIETLYTDFLRFGYHAGLALLVGGGIAVGIAAGSVFRTLRSRGDAANVVGAILARYDGLALLAVVVVVLTTILKAGAFEEDLRDWRILARYAAIALMSGAALYGIAWAGPVARAIRRETPGFDDLPEGDPRRREFRGMHERARRAVSAVVLFGLVAIFLS